MILRNHQLQRIEKLHLRGGAGCIVAYPLIAQEDMIGTPTMFNKIVLPPGASIGIHIHEGENEVFYVMSGEGLYHDNGKDERVYPGDVCINRPGDTHGIACAGEEELQLIALIQVSSKSKG